MPVLHLSLCSYGTFYVSIITMPIFMLENSYTSDGDSQIKIMIKIHCQIQRGSKQSNWTWQYFLTDLQLSATSRYFNKFYFTLLTKHFDWLILFQVTNFKLLNLTRNKQFKFITFRALAIITRTSRGSQTWNMHNDCFNRNVDSSRGHNCWCVVIVMWGIIMYCSLRRR